MKKSVTIILFTFLLFPIASQPYWVENAVEMRPIYDSEFFLFSVDDSIDNPAELSDNLTSYQYLLEKARRKYHEDTVFWMEKVFYFIQRKQLKTYENYVSFNETLANYKYDCVTGTALLSLILSDLGIEHEIVEFPYHVTITMVFNGRRVMMEATDPLYGFVKSQVEYDERIEFYLYSDEFPDPFMNVISVEQLAGLHYYNRAYMLFNDKKFEESFKMISKAEKLYPCSRVQSLKFQILSESSPSISARY